MRKNVTQLLFSLFLLAGVSNIYAQDKYGAEPEKCKTNLSIFYEYAKAKNYGPSYEPWTWVVENCPKGSKNIYKYGLLIAQDRYEKATGAQKETESQLVDKVYALRIVHFPDNLGKVYSDWATSLEKRGKSKAEVFAKLEKAFTTDPSRMSIKNLAKYYQEVTNLNKDTNAQKVFDTYDDALEAVNKKIDGHTKSKDMLDNKVASGATLSKKEARKLKNDGINLRGLGQVEGVLDQILGEVATCDRLIPLYNKGFESHKTDAKWLRRAASRLNAKECTDDPIFPKLVEAYVNSEPSADAYIYYATVLDKRGEKSEANSYRKKAVDLETDPYKKAGYLYKIGRTYGRSSTAASYARKALVHRPSMGKAYLLIASAYAASANSCGTDEFSKRMVYVAAANKARRAMSVDPSISSTAKKYIRSYTANQPNKKLVFTLGLTSGASHKIGCWIGETVKIP
jgi:tetratricopeptide (TPR) repeat protein